MSREVLVFRDGKMVPKHEAAPLTPRGKPGNFPCPNIRRDEISPIRHPCTGQVMTSLSEFRKVTRAHGCEEVGNEQLPAYKPPKAESMEETIAQAWEQVEQSGESECRERMEAEAVAEKDLGIASPTILTPPGMKPSETAEVTRAAEMLKAPMREVPELPAAKPVATE